MRRNSPKQPGTIPVRATNVGLRATNHSENNRGEVLFGRVFRNRCPILKEEMAQFGKKLIHIYKRLFEDRVRQCSQRSSDQDLADDRSILERSQNFEFYEESKD